MALMLRGAGFAKGGGGGSAMTKTGGVQLKAVHIAETANLYEKWKQAQEQREHDRREMKKVKMGIVFVWYYLLMTTKSGKIN